MTKLEFISKEIERLKAEGLFTQPRTIESAQGSWIVVEGRKVLNLCSNNYLGLANDPRLVEAAKRALEAYGAGPAAVRTIAGTQRIHTELESRLARFKGVESALSFQSGFNSNLAAIPAMVDEGDWIVSDELNHASIIDGCRLARARTLRYRHCDCSDLEDKLRSLTGGRKLVITDGVFSMDGDIAPLGDIVAVTEKYNAILMVDDAHGEGVLGNHGRGIVDHFGLHQRVDLEIGTMSKAFGCVGGYVASRKLVTDFLRQKARPLLFSSAMTAADVGACIAAVDRMEQSDEAVRRLWDNASYFKGKMAALGFDLGRSQTPITPVMLGNAERAKRFSSRLFEEGVFAMAIGFPTVPRGKARIRAMISAVHSREDLEFAAAVFEKVGNELGTEPHA